MNAPAVTRESREEEVRCDGKDTDTYGARCTQKQYEDLLEPADGRVIALGEVGAPPSPEVLNAQLRWAWFMGWAGHMDSPENAEAVEAIFSGPRTRARGEPLLWKSVALRAGLLPIGPRPLQRLQPGPLASP